MEYYLTMIKKEILPFATTWVKLEGIMLSEIRQKNKGSDFYVKSKKVELRNRAQIGGRQRWGVRGGVNGEAGQKVQTSTYK